jgi:hypothetical protein
MPLVNQFQITIKHFCPKPPARTLSDHSGPVAILRGRKMGSRIVGWHTPSPVYRSWYLGAIR